MFLLRKIGKLFYAILINALLFSCATTDNSRYSDKPNWIFHYHIEGKVCAVGTSLPHVKGFAYQRATAISRAIDEIARQKGVKVATATKHFLRGSKDHAISRLSVYSVQATTGQVVSSIVRDTWLDNKTEEFYVWMCTE